MPVAAGPAAATRTTPERGQAKKTVLAGAAGSSAICPSRVNAFRANRVRRRGEPVQRQSRRRDRRKEAAAPRNATSRGSEDFVMDRQEDGGVQRNQPQHGNDHTQPRQAVGHPHQRLRPSEKDHAASSPGQINGTSIPNANRAKSTVAIHRLAMAAAPYSIGQPASAAGRHRQREHAGGIDRWARGQVTGKAEAEHRQEIHEHVTEKGRISRAAVSLGVSSSMGSHGPGIRSLIIPRTSNQAGQRDQCDAMPLAKFPGDRGERGTALITPPGLTPRVSRHLGADMGDEDLVERGDALADAVRFPDFIQRRAQRDSCPDGSL